MDEKKASVYFSKDGKTWQPVPGARLVEVKVNITITGVPELKSALDQAGWTLRNLRKVDPTKEAAGPALDDPGVIDGRARRLD